MPEKWEDKEEACTKRNEEKRAKDLAGAEKEKCGKSQLDQLPKEEGSVNDSKKGREWIKKREDV